MAKAQQEQDRKWMLEAVKEAAAAQGWTHPNPAVGALVVRNGVVEGRGHTQPPGGAHAEVMALRDWRERGGEADAATTLYVTLEPCSTHGRTPPCTEAILGSGIRRVVVGAIDPNPLHRGRGLDVLMEAGIEVVSAVEATACMELNMAFHYAHERGRPLIAGKIATTLDGRIATRGGHSKWITGALARADVHRWRASFPAIAVGAGTVRTDNPGLTIRRAGQPDCCPIRFVFDRNLVSLRDPKRHVFSDQWKDSTIIVGLRGKAAEAQRFEQRHGIRFWLLDEEANDDGISEFITRCHAEGIHGVYIEGGAQLLSSFLKQRRIDYLFHYRAPVILADNSALSPFYGYEPSDMQRAIRLRKVRHALFADDQLIHGELVYPE